VLGAACLRLRGTVGVEGREGELMSSSLNSCDDSAVSSCESALDGDLSKLSGAT
jgi:hypothetical protein